MFFNKLSKITYCNNKKTTSANFIDKFISVKSLYNIYNEVLKDTRVDI
jgi:hypothetical protein